MIAGRQCVTGEERESSEGKVMSRLLLQASGLSPTRHPWRNYADHYWELSHLWREKWREVYI